MEHQFIEWQSLSPTLHRKLRLAVQFIDKAETEPGDDLDPLGNAQQRANIGIVKDADPADADAFGACRKPEILHGADRRKSIHPRIVCSPKHHAAGTVWITGDADAERRLA